MTTKTISVQPDQLREFLRCRESPAYFICNYVRIQHGDLGTIPFTLWPWQEKLVRRFERERQIIILKARQIGVTELAGSYALWLIRFHLSKKAIAISKNEDAAGEIMSRVTFSHDQLPGWLQAGPDAIDGCQLGKSNTSVLEFLHRDKDGKINPSSIQSLPATKSAGRSKSVALLILDEWAHQMFDKEIWSGVKATAEKGQIIGISTANGLGNVFQKTWMKAVAKQNSFDPIFLSWKRHPDRDDVWHEREAKDNEPWQMAQEYPSEPTEAFIQSGRPVFDNAYLKLHSQRLRDEAPTSISMDGLTTWEEPVKEERDGNGAIKVAAHSYIIAADVAEGLAHGDYDAAVVIDRSTWVEVAELHGHWPFDVYAQKLADLGRRYNNALLAVERNNHGHAVLLWLRTNGYTHLYHHVEPLVPSADQQDRPGWPTTNVTKPLIVDALAKGLRDMSYHTRSQPFLDEALVFAYQDNGSMSAPAGMHDDRVMCRAIGCHLLSKPDMGMHALNYMSQMAERVGSQAMVQRESERPGAIPYFGTKK